MLLHVAEENQLRHLNLDSTIVKKFQDALEKEPFKLKEQINTNLNETECPQKQEFGRSKSWRKMSL